MGPILQTTPKTSMFTNLFPYFSVVLKVEPVQEFCDSLRGERLVRGGGGRVAGDSSHML